MGAVRRIQMRNLFLVACLSLMLAPLGLQAQNNNNQGQNNNKQRQGAPEISAVGFGAAAAIGIAGYLWIRRRHATQN
jgi:hypothetical protein